MSKLLVVIGATGNQGGSVINAVLSDPSAKAQFSIRAISRSTDSAAAKALEAKGVEVVAGDVNDKASLDKAFKGAYAVFGVTDYWKAAGLDMQKEIQHGKNIVDAAKVSAAGVAQEANVQHFILSTLLSPKKFTNGALSKVYHFDGKDEITEYAKSSGVPTTYYLPGFYASNLPGQSLRKGEDGKYVLAIPSPADGPIPVIDIEADTGKFVKAALLNRDATLGKQLFGAEKYYTAEEVVDAFKTAFPKDGEGAHYWRMPDEMFVNVLKGTGMPEFAAEELLQNFQLFDKRYGYYAGADLGETHALLTDKLTPLSEFFKSSPAFKGLQ